MMDVFKYPRRRLNFYSSFYPQKLNTKYNITHSLNCMKIIKLTLSIALNSLLSMVNVP
jgi:hypothetical protein